MPTPTETPQLVHIKEYPEVTTADTKIIAPDPEAPEVVAVPEVMSPIHEAEVEAGVAAADVDRSVAMALGAAGSHERVEDARQRLKAFHDSAAGQQAMMPGGPDVDAGPQVQISELEAADQRRALAFGFIYDMQKNPDLANELRQRDHLGRGQEGMAEAMALAAAKTMNKAAIAKTKGKDEISAGLLELAQEDMDFAERSLKEGVDPARPKRSLLPWKW